MVSLAVGVALALDTTLAVGISAMWADVAALRLAWLYRALAVASSTIGVRYAAVIAAPVSR